MNLLRSAATVSGFTMMSRVLGFVRDILLAALVGAGPIADAFVVAFRFPNLFRRLFGEGAFNSAFVPLFARRLEGDGKAEAVRFAEEALAGLLFVLLIFLAIAELAMPLFITILAPGFLDDPEKFDLTVTMTRIAFPYLIFMSLVALLGGILNSVHRFTATAAAPVVLNIVMIAVLGWLTFAGWGNTPETGLALVWGVSLAGLLQLILLAVSVVRAGMPLKLRLPKMTPGVRRLIALGIPGVIAGGITQLNLLISTIIASLEDGAPTWLYFADRVYQLPLGVIGVAIGIVLLPDLSRRLKAGEDEAAQNSLNRSIEISMLLTLPAAFALMAIPLPIVQVLFERGVFSAGDSEATALALAAFAAGLPAFVLIKIFSPAFFAREDTKTPMYFAIAGMVINISGAIALFFVIGHVGIALATTMAAWVNAALLGGTLSRRGLHRTDLRLRSTLPRILLSSFAMGAVLLWGNGALASFFDNPDSVLLRIIGLAGLVAAGTAVYFGVAALTGAFRIKEVRAAFRRP